jgi:hypothetical protein
MVWAAHEKTREKKLAVPSRAGIIAFKGGHVFKAEHLRISIKTIE